MKSFWGSLFRSSNGVPVPIVLSLFLLAFLWGRLSHDAEMLPDGPRGTVDTRRTLKADAEQEETLATEKVVAVNTHELAVTPDALPHGSGGMKPTLQSLPNLMSDHPPLTPGKTGDNFYYYIPFQVISWFPRIYLFPRFLSGEECDHIMGIARNRMARSQLFFKPGDNPTEFTDTRTSDGTFLSYDMDETGILGEIERRIAAATHTPVENGEPFNVLRYKLTQHYDSHLDAWDPKFYGQQPSQRLATMITYLTDVEDGGHTVFKKEGQGNETRAVHDMHTCDDGSFKVKPRKGDAVLFYNLYPDGTLDQQAMHGGCPVISGEKWAMTKWIRDKPFSVRIVPKDDAVPDGQIGVHGGTVAA